MANRRFEMHEYRQILVRMRLGDSDRDIARTGLMGRRKAGEVRQLAQEQGWLDVSQALPDDEGLARVLIRPSARAQTTSQVVPFAADVKKWARAGIQGTTIHDALVRKHGFTGSYSAVRRFLHSLHLSEPEATTILEFEPGDTAQVDFGRGPTITDVETGEIIKSWIFVMVLAWSRHMYAELVVDQKIPPGQGAIGPPASAMAAFRRLPFSTFYPKPAARQGGVVCRLLHGRHLAAVYTTSPRSPRWPRRCPTPHARCF